MNTKNKVDQKNRRQKTRQRPKKQGQSSQVQGRKFQEHEHPEMRMTR
jgi:hypothetical protein